MTKKDKLLIKAEHNPDGLSFDDFCSLMKHRSIVRIK